ncbi:MAG: metallophosphoesterase family protein [Christensenellales bacterium]|jgi:predicted phosphodiesterase
MRLAVLADIHSNATALTALRQRLTEEGVDGVCILGDLVSNCPQPRRVLDLLADWSAHTPCWVLAGNRERYLLAARQAGGPPWLSGSSGGSLRYTYQALRPADWAYLEGLPTSLRLELPGCAPIRLVHGSPGDDREHMIPGDPATEAYLESCAEPVMLCAHTHRPFLYGHGGKLLVNPGPVSGALEGDVRARYALLTGTAAGWRAQLAALAYDIAAEQRVFFEDDFLQQAGVWGWAIYHTLSRGGNLSYRCGLAAQRLASSEGCSERDWARIPERFWVQAARQMGLPLEP